jgi:hypothetical protein
MKVKHLLLLIIIASFSSCSVIQGTQKDGAMFVAKQDLRQQTKDLFNGIKNGNKNYLTWAATYASVDSLAKAIKAHDETRKKADKLVRQDVLFINQFAIYWLYHTTHPLTSGDANVYMKSMDALAKPMVISEYKK